LFALAASLAAIALYLFVHHRIVGDVNCNAGNVYPIICVSEVRPGWVEPVAVALLALASAAVVGKLLSASRLHKYFAKLC
jgi:hypothetical protein